MLAVGPAVPQQTDNGGLNQTIIACFAISFRVHCVACFPLANSLFEPLSIGVGAAGWDGEVSLFNCAG